MYAGLLDAIEVGWRPDNVESTGVMLFRKLTRVVCYLDTHHMKFSSRGTKLPEHFSQFQGYNEKEKESHLSVPDLEQHIKEYEQVTKATMVCLKSIQSSS